MTSYLMALVMCTPSLTIYAIFAEQIKFQKFDLENEGHGTELEITEHATFDLQCLVPYR